ncbi:ABC transporter permease [Phocaeicola massiliensis]|uniref:ABC transporter permease n=1 Tax=Phocaeicola massiliensis TaxID=204516 RepID=UPI00189D0568|nr:FtsX-like permease family protein [Phocaeicola massiliensis]
MKQLKYAIQNVIRGKGSNIVKVVSITLGLLVSVILIAKVAYELSYDNFYRDNEQLYVVKTGWDGGKPLHGNNIYPTAAAIARHFSAQVESFTTVTEAYGKMSHGNKAYRETVLMVDSAFFQTMGLPLYKGNALDLANPDMIFLSESFAKEVFGSDGAVGKTLLYNIGGDYQPFIVKGIYADIPLNTTLYRPKAVISIANRTKYYKGGLGWNTGGNYQAFVRLKHSKADAEIINKGITSIIMSQYMPMDHYGKFGVKGIEVMVSPLRGLHLDNWNTVKMLYIMGILAIALLFTATLNYVLISLSSLAYRAKAIGVHKCNGAGTGGIFGMFLWETAIIVCISLALIAFIILNFNEKIEELIQTPVGELFSLQNIWTPALVVLFLFFIGGIMPGRFFSSIPVTQVFRQYTENKKRWKYPLLFVQFAGTAFLVGMTCVVFSQYHYTMSKDLGYNMERLASVYDSYEHVDNTLSLLHNLPYVEGAATAEAGMLGFPSPYPVNDNSGNMIFSPRLTFFDREFFNFIGMRLKTGKAPTAEGEILVNEEFVRAMKWDNNGVGEYVPEHGTVTGILDGFRFIDAAQMEPVEIRWSSGRGNVMHVRLKEPFDDNLKRLNEEMKKLYPQDNVQFTSYAKQMERSFHSERVFRDSIILATIAILAITLMGLVGYINDEIRRRSKEIAIRKINGAEVKGILLMLSTDVIRIAVPAILIGVVLSHYTGMVWKSQFRDVMTTDWLFYTGVFIVVLAFIVGCVIIKSWRIANENPILSLKNE